VALLGNALLAGLVRSLLAGAVVRPGRMGLADAAHPTYASAPVGVGRDEPVWLWRVLYTARGGASLTQARGVRPFALKH